MHTDLTDDEDHDDDGAILACGGNKDLQSTQLHKMPKPQGTISRWQLYPI